MIKKIASAQPLHRNPAHPLFARLQQHVERLQQWRVEFTEDANRKRLLRAIEENEDTEGSKRQRLSNSVNDVSSLPPFKIEIPMPLSQLYTLTSDEGCKNFDVQAIPVDIVAKILVPMLTSIAASQIESATNVSFLVVSLQRHGGICRKSTSHIVATDCNCRY